MRKPRKSVFKLTQIEQQIFALVESGMSLAQASAAVGDTKFINGNEYGQSRLGEKFRMHRILQREEYKSHEPISPKRAKGNVMMEHR